MRLDSASVWISAVDSRSLAMRKYSFRMLRRCMLSSTTITCFSTCSSRLRSSHSRTSRWTARRAGFHAATSQPPRFPIAASTLATCTSSSFHPRASVLFPAPGSPQSTATHVVDASRIVHVGLPHVPGGPMACAMWEADVGATSHVRPGPRIRGVLKHR